MLLGQYLVPDIDVVSVITANILKKTGEVFPRSTLCTLKMEEIDNPDLDEQRRNFDEAVIAKLDDTTSETDFPEEQLTPTYDAYVNNMTEGTPNAPDKYL